MRRIVHDTYLWGCRGRRGVANRRCWIPAPCSPCHDFLCDIPATLIGVPDTDLGGRKRAHRKRKATWLQACSSMWHLLYVWTGGVQRCTFTEGGSACSQTPNRASTSDPYTSPNQRQWPKLNETCKFRANINRMRIVCERCKMSTDPVCTCSTSSL